MARVRFPVDALFDPFLNIHSKPAGEAISRVSSNRRASIAQMVERKTLNLVVVGSIPTGGAVS